MIFFLKTSRKARREQHLFNFMMMLHCIALHFNKYLQRKSPLHQPHPPPTSPLASSLPSSNSFPPPSRHSVANTTSLPPYYISRQLNLDTLLRRILSIHPSIYLSIYLIYARALSFIHSFIHSLIHHSLCFPQPNEGSLSHQISRPLPCPALLISAVQLVRRVRFRLHAM